MFADYVDVNNLLRLLLDGGLVGDLDWIDCLIRFIGLEYVFVVSWSGRMLYHFAQCRGGGRGDRIPEASVLAVSDSEYRLPVDKKLRLQNEFPQDQWQELADLKSEGLIICEDQPPALADERGIMHEDSFHHALSLHLQLLMIH